MIAPFLGGVLIEAANPIRTPVNMPKRSIDPDLPLRRSERSGKCAKSEGKNFG